MASDRTVLLALAQTLTNKTLTSPVVTTPTITSPVINTGVSGTAVLDEDDMATDSNTQLATQQSIKAFVTSGGITMTNKRLTAPKLNEDVSVAATATEINTACVGVTVAAADITASAVEINSVCTGASSTSITLGGDFGGTENFNLVKIGKMVVAQCETTTFTSATSAESAAGVIPAAYRPAVNVAHHSVIGNTYWQFISVTTGGTITAFFTDFVGSAVSKTTAYPDVLVWITA